MEWNPKFRNWNNIITFFSFFCSTNVCDDSNLQPLDWRYNILTNWAIIYLIPQYVINIKLEDRSRDSKGMDKTECQFLRR